MKLRILGKIHHDFKLADNKTFPVSFLVLSYRAYGVYERAILKEAVFQRSL